MKLEIELIERVVTTRTVEALLGNGPKTRPMGPPEILKSKIRYLVRKNGKLVPTKWL